MNYSVPLLRKKRNYYFKLCPNGLSKLAIYVYYHDEFYFSRKGFVSRVKKKFKSFS